PTPMPVVEAMLELARVHEGDVVFDIGSGDGRIVIAAAELFGARGVGIEIDEELVERSRRTAAEKNLGNKVQIIHANALDVDLSPADVVTVYLTPNGLILLRPNLESMLRPGTRVVAHDFAVPDWTPAEEREVMGRTLYLYLIR
ncbi:MAG: SAM-dependent methyltransferase, partial [bacterium]